MARQKLGKKKLAKLRNETGLPIIAVLVRGGTDHRKDLCLEGGKVIHLFNDGTMQESDIGHTLDNNENR